MARPQITSMQNIAGPVGIISESSTQELQVIRGTDAGYNIDGSVTLDAKARLHLRAEEVPPFLVRVSRRTDGASCPHSSMRRILFTGHTKDNLALFIDDGSEITDYGLFEMNQDNPEASCMILSNVERKQFDPTPTNRKAATNSQKWIHDGIFNKRFRSVKRDRSMAACLRITGEVTQLKVERTYFTSEEEETPAIVIVNMPDEQGADWFRANCPNYIDIVDCTWEGPGKGKIILFGMPESTVINITGAFANSFEIVRLPYDGVLNDPVTPPFETDDYVPNTDPIQDLLNIVRMPELIRKDGNLFAIREQLPAGTVLELRGGTYSQTLGNYRPINLNGTADNPVILRGIDWPRFSSTLHVSGSHALIEGIDVKKLSFAPGSHHIRVRKCRVHGDAAAADNALHGGGIAIAGSTTANINNIIIEDNVIYDNGSGPSVDFDEDVHGITINGNTNNILIKNNVIFGNSGDGVQINAGSKENERNVNRIFVLNNTIYGNKQVGVALKQCDRVVVAFNEIHSHTPVGSHPSAWGAAIGLQYNPINATILENYCHNNADGITTSSGSDLGTGDTCFIVGNTITMTRHNEQYPYNPNTAWSNAGIRKAGVRNMIILNNYIQSCDAGINIVDVGGEVDIQGNVILDVVNNHLFVETNNGTLTFSNNNLDQGNFDDVKFRLGNQVARNQFTEGNKRSRELTNKLTRHSFFSWFNSTYGVNVA